LEWLKIHISKPNSYHNQLPFIPKSDHSKKLQYKLPFFT
jgi:hypothetical protein